jgi:hypothetical protein
VSVDNITKSVLLKGNLILCKRHITKACLSVHDRSINSNARPNVRKAGSVGHFMNKSGHSLISNKPVMYLSVITKCNAK